MNSQQLSDLKAELLQHPPNPNPPKSPYGERRSLVASLLDEISFLREQGFPFDDISNILNEKSGVLIRPKTLRRYFTEEQTKLSDKKLTRPQRRKALSSPPKPRSSKATQPVDKTIPATPVAVAADPEPKARAKPDKIPAAPEPDETLASPVATNSDADKNDNWGGHWSDDDDDSYTTGLLNEPKFNRIPHK